MSKRHRKRQRLSEAEYYILDRLTTAKYRRLGDKWMRFVGEAARREIGRCGQRRKLRRMLTDAGINPYRKEWDVWR